MVEPVTGPPAQEPSAADEVARCPHADSETLAETQWDGLIIGDPQNRRGLVLFTPGPVDAAAVPVGPAVPRPRHYRVATTPLTGVDGTSRALVVLRDSAAPWCARPAGSRRIVTEGAEAAGRAEGAGAAGDGDPDGQREAAGWAEVVERLSWFLEGTTDHAIFLLDAEGRMATWGDSAQQILHGSEQDLVGSLFDDLLLPADQALGVGRHLLSEAGATGRSERAGLQRRADGNEFWARTVLTAVRSGEPGALLGFVCVVHDVTAEHAAQQQLITLNREMGALSEQVESRVRQRTDELETKAAELGLVNRALVTKAEELALANHELEAFSYSVSHDLRAPLRAMSGFAQLLEEDHSDDLDDVGRHYVTRIGAAARQMSQLIDDLLAFSRLMRQPLAAEPLDMTTLVRDAWRNARPAASRARLELPLLPPGRGDRQLVLEVWQNLLENAVKFSRDSADPLVTVSGESVGGLVWYTVGDNGVGFDMHFVDRLFRPFQRLHRAEDFPGTGIGLALVDRIVRRHGGAVEASAAPGSGASFRFTLGPLPDPPPGPAPE